MYARHFIEECHVLIKPLQEYKITETERDLRQIRLMEELKIMTERERILLDE